MRALSAMGTDVMVIANHEFDRGALNLATPVPELGATSRSSRRTTSSTIPTSPARRPSARHRQALHRLRPQGLKVGVIGMGNLSSLTSIFDMPEPPRDHAAQHHRDRAVLRRPAPPRRRRGGRGLAPRPRRRRAHDRDDDRHRRRARRAQPHRPPAAEARPRLLRGTRYDGRRARQPTTLDSAIRRCDEAGTIRRRGHARSQSATASRAT